MPANCRSPLCGAGVPHKLSTSFAPGFLQIDVTTMPNDQAKTNGTEKTAMDEHWRPPILEGEPPVPPGKPTGIKVDGLNVVMANCRF